MQWVCAVMGRRPPNSAACHPRLTITPLRDVHTGIDGHDSTWSTADVLQPFIRPTAWGKPAQGNALGKADESHQPCKGVAKRFADINGHISNENPP